MSAISVRFWGVRGSIACAERNLARYGGNTSCVEARCADRLFIFDAGTGLRPLGRSLIAQAGDVDADIFLSHYHLDHICGLPFFAPLYRPGSRVRIWGAINSSGHDVEASLRTMMADPLFPLSPDVFKAKLEFRAFRAGDVLQPHPAVTLRTAALNHPGGAAGYRLEHDNRAVAYITDTEHRPGEPDGNVLALATGAGLMIYDSNYTDDEFPARVGWGHSTWQESLRIAETAGVKRPALFHHDPEHDDEFLDRVDAQAKARHAGAFVAAEGTTVVT